MGKIDPTLLITDAEATERLFEIEDLNDLAKLVSITEPSEMVQVRMSDETACGRPISMSDVWQDGTRAKTHTAPVDIFDRIGKLFAYDDPEKGIVELRASSGERTILGFNVHQLGVPNSLQAADLMAAAWNHLKELLRSLEAMADRVDECYDVDGHPQDELNAAHALLRKFEKEGWS